MDIIITDMTGHSFTIKLNWDICIMKQSISAHYEIKLFKDFLHINNISKKEYRDSSNHMFKWMESELYKRVDDYYYDDIELIYNNEVLEQYHVECDLFTEEMIKENNNMSFVIIKKDRPSYDNDIDNNSIYSNESD